MIYFLRHGLDDENYIGGWSNIDLTEEGKTQIFNTNHFITTNNIKFDKIYCSDIKRAVTTSYIIKGNSSISIIETPILRELNKGLLNGMLKEDAQKSYPEIFNKMMIDSYYPNGESMLSFYYRIKTDLKRILSLDKSLIVTHRGVINMLYFILNDLPLDIEKEQFFVLHGSLHEYNPLTKKLRKMF